MDFDFSDDQVQLGDAVRKWVDKGYTFERRRAAEKAAALTAPPGTSWPSWACAACTCPKTMADWAWAR